MKTRTLMRTGIYLILILFLLLVAILVWPSSPPSPDAVAQRGLKPPPGFEMPASDSDTSYSSIGTPRDWIDQGLESLAGWNDNPLGIRHLTTFSQHLSDLKRSKDPKDQEEYHRLLALAKKWRDNLLTRYPELKVQYRDVPDDRNALKRLFDLRERLRSADGSYGPSLPDDLRQQLSNKKPWDAAAAQAWVDANRGTLDELRAISKMPDSSIKDCDEDYFFFDGINTLLIDARLAADRRDYAASLESLRAVRGIASILQGSEAPPLFHQFVGAGMQVRLRDCVFQSIMPAIPAGEVDRAAWEDLLKPEVQTPADFARTVKGEWNFGMQYYLLPAMADPAESQSPYDAEAFIETYTNHRSKIVNQYENLSLTELPSSPAINFDTSGLSWRSRRIAGDNLEFRYLDAWQRHQIQAGMTQAAFAILKGQPVPNDPVFGKPYQWNPETRELSRPAGPEFKNMGTKPLILPKL